MTDIRIAMGNLALQIAQLHLITVRQQQASHPRRGKVERCRTTQATQAHYQYGGGLQPLLSRHVEVVDQYLAVIAQQLFITEHQTVLR